MNNLPTVHAFDNFRFDTDRLALYHKDILVKTADKKTMQVLVVLLLRPNRLTTHEEIIEKVWEDNPLGVTSGHIGQYISRLRKVFAEFAPENKYIETVKGRGYSFVGDISTNETEAIKSNDKQFESHSFFPEAEPKDRETSSAFTFSKLLIVFLSLIPVFLLVFLGWAWLSESNEEKIRQVVKESQMFESLVIYKNPASFNESDLDKYWTKELETGTNYDRQRIRESIKKLNAEGRRYGSETKCEQFEFQSVEINQDKNFAVVKTLEKWFIAVYFNDGTLQKNKYVGPYFVSYILRKVDGRWLIEKSNTARINRPTPRLSGVETVSTAKAGQQFFVKITGQDFEAETVCIEISGEGCPASRPCKVPNSALRERSKLSETVLDNVPLTLGSGDFQLVVHNGDSPMSNPIVINVPQ